MGGSQGWLELCKKTAKPSMCHKLLLNSLKMIRYLPEKSENVHSQAYMHPYFYCSIIHGGQDMDATKLSLNRWLDKMWCIDTMEYYSAIRKDEILSFATTWLDLGNIILNDRQKKSRTI